MSTTTGMFDAFPRPARLERLMLDICAQHDDIRQQSRRDLQSLLLIGCGINRVAGLFEHVAGEQIPAGV